VCMCVCMCVYAYAYVCMLCVSTCVVLRDLEGKAGGVGLDWWYVVLLFVHNLHDKSY
jgi:hypothetical protein